MLDASHGAVTVKIAHTRGQTLLELLGLVGVLKNEGVDVL